MEKHTEGQPREDLGSDTGHPKERADTLRLKRVDLKAESNVKGAYFFSYLDLLRYSMEASRMPFH